MRIDGCAASYVLHHTLYCCRSEGSHVYLYLAVALELATPPPPSISACALQAADILCVTPCPPPTIRQPACSTAQSHTVVLMFCMPLATCRRMITLFESRSVLRLHCICPATAAVLQL